MLRDALRSDLGLYSGVAGSQSLRAHRAIKSRVAMTRAHGARLRTTPVTQNTRAHCNESAQPTPQIKGQGPGLVNVLWAGTTMPEHVSYRDVKNKYTVGYEIGQRADPHAIADRKPQAVTKLHGAIARRKRHAPPRRNPSAHLTWTRRRASSGHERPSSARKRPGASPRSNARRSASWRWWRSLLCLQMRRRHSLSRTAPGSRASRSHPRVEYVGPTR